MATSIHDYHAHAVGVAWFTKEDYPALRAVFEDGDKYASYEQWEKGAQETERRFQADGYIVERVYIDPDAFPEWCRKEGVGVNREGRMRFASSAVAAKYGQNQS